MFSGVMALGSRVTVRFPLSDLPTMDLLEVELVQAAAAHDVWSIRMKSRSNDTRHLLLDSAPVILTIYSRAGRREYAGYVHHVNKPAGGTSILELVCVGVTYPLMSKSLRTFTDRTASSIVAEIASEYRLGYDIEAHGRVYSHLSSNGLSDWQLLRKLSADTGYVLRSDASRIQFVSRDRLTSFFKPLSPVLSRRQSATDADWSIRLVNFTPLSGEFTPQVSGSSAIRSITGIDYSTGLSVSLRTEGDTPFADRLADAVSTTFSEAEYTLKAAQELNRFRYRATATVHGSPELTRDRTVYVSGVSAKHDGYWTVLEAKHLMKARGRYEVVLELGAEDLYQGTQEPVSAPVIDNEAFNLLNWPYEDPVLESRPDYVGLPGSALKMFRWVAPVVDHRSVV